VKPFASTSFLEPYHSHASDGPTRTLSNLIRTTEGSPASSRRFNAWLHSRTNLRPRPTYTKRTQSTIHLKRPPTCVPACNRLRIFLFKRQASSLNIPPIRRHRFRPVVAPLFRLIQAGDPVQDGGRARLDMDDNNIGPIGEECLGVETEGGGP
jgi:hypothetical protein